MVIWLIPLKHNESEFTYDKIANCYYFYTRINDRNKHYKTIEAKCKLDISEDGTLIGVELVNPSCKAKKSWS